MFTYHLWLNNNTKSRHPFGNLFKITKFGESHGTAIGVILAACHPRIDFDMDFLQSELDKSHKRKLKNTLQRKERDTAQILSGIFEGKPTGTPIAILIPNEDQR